jgi:hypothetical protein
MTHQHHWVIDPPEDVESGARCRSCSAVRTFRNVPAQISSRELYRAAREPAAAGIGAAQRGAVALADEESG